MKKDLLIIFFLILPAFSRLLQTGFFPVHDNLQAMRQLQMDKCFSDGQFPCRWVSDMGLGYGYPLFVFYPPLPYYVGQIFKMTGLSYLDSVKAVGVVGFLLPAVFMYFLAREFFGRKGAISAALFFTYAPYHSVDYFVRGAVNEFYAMAFYPAVFLFSYRLLKKPTITNSLSLSLSLSLLMLSHNPMLMIFAPFYAGWLIFWLIKTRCWASLKFLILSNLLAIGLAAFFTLPILIEQQYVHIETLTIGYFNYLQHFLNLDQLFLHTYWGYGSSGLNQRTMSFAVGYLHWIVPALLIVFALLKRNWLVLLLGSFLLLSLFMTHSRSTFVYQLIPQLQIIQFPWRFLTLSVFFSSLITGGAFTPKIISKRARYFLPFLIALLLLLNASYFRPREWWSNITDNQVFSAQSWLSLQAASIYDYLPKTASVPPADPASSNLVLSSGTYSTILKKSNYQEYQINSDFGTTAEIQTFSYPGWQTRVDGMIISPTLEPLFGRPQITLSPGSHTLVYQFTSTPIRLISDIVSLVSWGILLAIIFLWLMKLLWMILIFIRSKIAHSPVS